jgi:hypothetical protein
VSERDKKFSRGVPNVAQLLAALLLISIFEIALHPGIVLALGDVPSAAVNAPVSVADLPKGVDKVPSPGMSNEQRVEFLNQQPDLILDHQTLRLTDASHFPNIFLTVNHLKLLHGATIVTNGASLQITAATVESDGGVIVSFEEAVRPFAAVGLDGETGHDGGTVVIDSALQANQVLHVNLRGQDGQNGGPGLSGPSGVMGPRGESGADHILDCAHGAGNGGPGSKGGPGGNGGAGGRGGSGGKLILRGSIVAQRFQLDFLAPPGKGGSGGAGGLGGPGGAGGPGGSGTTYCRSASQGPSGLPGDSGAPGMRGQDGEAGKLLAD